MATNFNLTYRLADGFNAPVAAVLFGQIDTLAPDPIASIQSESNTVAPLLAALTQSEIVSAIATVEIGLPSLPSGRPVAGTFNKLGGNLDYTSNAPGDGVTLFIGNFQPTLIGPNGKTIANAGAVLAFTTELVTPTVAVAHFTDEDRNFITAFFRGSTGTRKLRRAYGDNHQRPRVLG